MSDTELRYPPIADYALIGNCRCTALISRIGSIDWCCMPDIDSDSCFGRLLDWEKGGHCLLAAVDSNVDIQRRYLPGTMILETTFRQGENEARLVDFFVMDGGAERTLSLVRLLEGVRGEMRCCLLVRPRLDFGEIIPHTRKYGDGLFVSVGSNKGLVFRTDIAAEVVDHRDLKATFTIEEGRRLRLDIHFRPPEMIAENFAPEMLPPMESDGGLDATRRAWERWSNRLKLPEEFLQDADQHKNELTKRSALVLRALTMERTGAIAAAPTTSLPESIGGIRNWDYRFSWVRDSVFTVRALYRLGYEEEAERFMCFIRRSSAGSAHQLQIMYGVDGKRRLTEVDLGWLEGYRGSRPVRIGNLASRQSQLDIYGEIMELAWVWHHSGHAIDRPYWDFLIDVVDTACAQWDKPDFGIWEIRGAPRHHVHSKAMCWSAVDFGVKLAESCDFSCPLQRWSKTRNAIRQAIEHHGYDGSRGIFIQTFGAPHLDAALLLLPRIGFVNYDDPRMLRTAEAIRNELDDNGLVMRYTSPDGLPGDEGVFLPCTFWLVACLARQGRTELAWRYYERAAACANDLGLFSEEFDTRRGQMLGNFPQGLTHVSQMTAHMALMEASMPFGRPA